METRSQIPTGDLTLLNGEVTEVNQDGAVPVATVHVVMTNQNDDVMATGDAKLRLPTESTPEA